MPHFDQRLAAPTGAQSARTPAGHRCWLATLAALALTMVAPAAVAQAPDAQQYPAKPIRLIISTASGGSLDLMARLLGEKLNAAWGQPVIVESKPGANSMLAAAFVAKAPADGYTVLFTISAVMQNVLLRANTPYKLQELAPVSLFALFPYALVCSTTLPVTTLAEYLALAKQKPKSLSYGSYGVGSSAHIAAESLNRAAGVDIVHIPYKGEADSFADLTTGRLSSAYGTTGFYARQLNTGKIRLLAVASPHRLRDFPNLPTFSDAGFPNINLPGWGGIFMPAGTPKEIVTKFSQAVQKVVAMPDVQAKIYELGFEPSGMTSDAFAQHIQTDLEKWGSAIKAIDIKLD